MATRTGSGRRDEGGRERRAPRRPDRRSSPRRPRGGERPGPDATIRTRRRRWGLALGVVVVLGALLAATLVAPWLDVTRVEVAGAAPETRGAVEEAAAVAPGTSLLWLDGDPGAGALADRVRALPRVAAVDVGRRWPHTLVLTVSEREPLLAVPGVPGGPVGLVDASGLAYRTIAVAPRGVPVLRLPLGAAAAPDDPSTRAAVRVLSSLPPDLRRQVGEVRANGAFDVTLALAGDRTVRWGAAGDDARKAAVLRALLTRPGSVYDVSSPDLAVVR